ncbi:MAG: biopolymer transporter ExbD [Kiritimatiellales bacterium]|nr:biopolymer transporter ExbD [Kiritimatiellales bacterium]
MRKRKTSLIAIREVSDINLTPMMDLTFILLITFIITFPMIEQGISVKLPTGKGELKDSKDSRSITIDAGGNLFLDSQPVSKEELAQEIKLTIDNNPAATVYLSSDVSVNYGRVAEVVGLLKDAKVERMGLVTAGE